PGHHWSQYCKVFKVKRTKRGPGPACNRIDGPGFTIWISDGALFDSRTTPPTWEIRLESPAALNPPGEQSWQQICHGIERFIQQAGLERVENSIGGRN